MAEYIEREALKKKLEDRQGWQDQKAACVFKEGYDCGLEAALEDVEQAPAADVAPVVHGKWYHTGEVEWSCTNCGNVIATKDSWECPTKQYCDECGARMDGGEEDAAD